MGLFKSKKKTFVIIDDSAPTIKIEAICIRLGHCYLHLIEHGTWKKYWCCQCESYLGGGK